MDTGGITPVRSQVKNITVSGSPDAFSGTAPSI